MTFKSLCDTRSSKKLSADNPLAFSLYWHQAKWCVSIRIHKTIYDKLGWSQGTKLDMLVDREDGMAFLRADDSGRTFSINKNSPGSGYVRYYTLTPPFDNPVKVTALPLTEFELVDGGILFTMPVIGITNDKVRYILSNGEKV